MQKYDAIEKAILEKDVNRLREAMGDICYTNRSFSDGEFDQVLGYIGSKGIDIFDLQLNGKLISEDKSEYSDDDFARAVFELKKNFCLERINDVKKIGKILYKPKPILQIQKPISTANPGTVPNAPSRRKLTNQAKIAILAAGIIILIVLLLLVVK